MGTLTRKEKETRVGWVVKGSMKGKRIWVDRKGSHSVRGCVGVSCSQQRRNACKCAEVGIRASCGAWAVTRQVSLEWVASEHPSDQ